MPIFGSTLGADVELVDAGAEKAAAALLTADDEPPPAIPAGRAAISPRSTPPNASTLHNGAPWAANSITAPSIASTPRASASPQEPTPPHGQPPFRSTSECLPHFLKCQGPYSCRSGVQPQ